MFHCKIRHIAIFLLGMLLPCRMILADFALEDSHFINPQYSKKISLDFKNAPLTEVLKVFSKQANMNFVAQTDISNARVTLYLTNVPIEEALDYVLSANDLAYLALPGDNTFAVIKKIDANTKLVTKVFHLKHATVSNSLLKNTFPASDSLGGATSSASASATLGGIADAVKMVLTKSGSLAEDSRTNSFIVTDVESQMPIIEQTITKLDVVIPQILIEVDMLDISKKTSDLMGAKWGDAIFKFTGASKLSILPFDQTAALVDTKTALIDPSKAVSLSNSPYTVGALDFSKMSVIVNFLKSQTDTKNLASPRILTLNNQVAQIQVSTDEAIGTKTSNFASSSATSSVEAERTKTGVFLTVTPQADLDTREILMAVYPRVIEAITGDTFSTGTGTVSFKNAEERGTKSYLRVKDGQTIILGGLLKNQNLKVITKVPILGDIPFLGAAFRHKEMTGTKRELVIFLTPHILDDNKSYGEQIEERNPQFRWDEVKKAIETIEKEK